MATTVVAAQNFEPQQRRRATLLERLRQDRKVDAGAVARAELVAARTGQPVEQVLNQLGSLADDDLVALYAAVANCPIWDPDQTPVAPDLSELGVTAEYLRRAKLLPLRTTGRALLFAAGDPLDDEALSGLVFATGKTIAIQVARPTDLRRGFDLAFGASEAAPVIADERRLDREVDLISDNAIEGGGARLVQAAFEAAIAVGASDIHFEPRRHDLQIRLRVDGRLLDHQIVSADFAAPAVSRVKVLANLNLGERRLPQDGRTTFVIQGKRVDVRVATSPTVFGESAVLRILDRTTVPLDLDAMGLSPHLTACLRQAARSPHGIFLVTGPTGSGKTTTLYGLLQTFARSDKKVLSVEDPVEYHFEHVTQTQVAPGLGLTFAAALRSFLRQDPDVILVGEIRDPETAAVAIQAAMTGHFVLASVHANSALAVLPRLQDMGVEPYQLAAGFRGVVAQRLVRKLCPHCRVEARTEESVRLACVDANLVVPARVFAPAGCDHCQGVGFRGRAPIGEGFLASEPLLRAIAERRGVAEIEALARQDGLGAMLADGLEKVAAGVTTFDEVVAAVHG
ncbi:MULTISPECIES: GspE/PulE family protein [unclassified Caulobacter]|uniref:GspE/PulE family protein n=1 Tax=unclassified Caulobacter TaxID=2648921 RepID=UPI0006F557E0|nr:MULTISPECIES: GspE/PulE family protein [unclassified Caulobacter]KQV58689.1 secretion system protein E [Caulobacter sp. Root342]KQV68802.1 secretion system protein E [Caulobacter sp. Root343]